MTVSGGGREPSARADEAVGVTPVSSSPTGDLGIPLEPTTLVWEPLTHEQRDAYEREYRRPPPGYRGTGHVSWFGRFHPDTAPCAICGTVTDRFEIQDTIIGTVSEPPSPTYGNHCLCGVMIPHCETCTRARSIATLERRQLNLEILERVRVREAQYLTELRAELAQAAA